MTLDKVVKKTSVTCLKEGDWIVFADKDDGSTTNFGNFKTREEAMCVSDFINSGIAKGVQIDSIRRLNDALDVLTGRTK